MNATQYLRNADGGVVNPPILPEWEDRITAAMHAADYNAIVRLTAQYNSARDELVKTEEGDGSTGLGWSDNDMRGGLADGATGADIRPRFPDGGGQPFMPAGLTDAQLAEQQQLRSDVRDLRQMIGQLIAQGNVPAGAAVDAPTPTVDAATKPLGSTTVSAGRMDAPTPAVPAATPLGGTGVTAGPADPPNPVTFPTLTPGGGATGASDAPGETR